MTTTSNPQSLRTRDVGCAAYFSIGVTLFMLKFLIDWSVAHLIFDRKWSPAEYVAPGASIALLFTEPHARTFYTTMLIVALPFIAVGVWLTAMRLRSVGITPGWTVLFPAVQGLLVQRGSLLSHSAIVAREIGLPCIVGVAGLMETLRTGEWVEMDGATGAIRRIEPEEAPDG